MKDSGCVYTEGVVKSVGGFAFATSSVGWVDLVYLSYKSCDPKKIHYHVWSCSYAESIFSNNFPVIDADNNCYTSFLTQMVAPGRRKSELDFSHRPVYCWFANNFGPLCTVIKYPLQHMQMEQSLNFQLICLSYGVITYDRRWLNADNKITKGICLSTYHLCFDNIVEKILDPKLPHPIEDVRFQGNMQLIHLWVIFYSGFNSFG